VHLQQHHVDQPRHPRQPEVRHRAK
jgi:hypothetical protein